MKIKIIILCIFSFVAIILAGIGAFATSPMLVYMATLLLTACAIGFKIYEKDLGN